LVLVVLIIFLPLYSPVTGEAKCDKPIALPSLSYCREVLSRSFFAVNFVQLEVLLQVLDFEVFLVGAKVII